MCHKCRNAAIRRNVLQQNGIVSEGRVMETPGGPFNKKQDWMFNSVVKPAALPETKLSALGAITIECLKATPLAGSAVKAPG